MPETQFIIWLEKDVKILVFRNTQRGRYTSFAVVLTHQTEAGWVDVGRFDTAHGVPHRDVLGKKAGLLQKIWYDDVPPKSVFHIAIEMFKTNYKSIIHDYSEK